MRILKAIFMLFWISSLDCLAEDTCKTDKQQYTGRCNFSIDTCSYTVSGRWARKSGHYKPYFSIQIPEGHSKGGYMVYDYALHDEGSILSQTITAGQYSLSFWYFLTNKFFPLSVNLNTQNSQKLLWNNTVSAVKNWTQLVLNLESNTDFKIAFTSKLSGFNTVGIDDILLESQTSKNESQGSCPFSSQTDICGYSLQPKWAVQQGIFRSQQSPLEIESSNNDGYFMLFNPMSNSNGNNTVSTPCVDSGTYCLQFWYISLSSQTNLTIVFNTAGMPKTLGNLTGRQMNWTQYYFNISAQENFQITFNSILAAHATASTGLDNIRMRRVQNARDCVDLNKSVTTPITTSTTTTTPRTTSTAAATPTTAKTTKTSSATKTMPTTKSTITTTPTTTSTTTRATTTTSTTKKSPITTTPTTTSTTTTTPTTTSITTTTPSTTATTKTLPTTTSTTATTTKINKTTSTTTTTSTATSTITTAPKITSTITTTPTTTKTTQKTSTTTTTPSTTATSTTLLTTTSTTATTPLTTKTNKTTSTTTTTPTTTSTITITPTTTSTKATTPTTTSTTTTIPKTTKTTHTTSTTTTTPLQISTTTSTSTATSTTTTSPITTKTTQTTSTTTTKTTTLLTTTTAQKSTSTTTKMPKTTSTTTTTPTTVPSTKTVEKTTTSSSASISLKSTTFLAKNQTKIFITSTATDTRPTSGTHNSSITIPVTASPTWTIQTNRTGKSKNYTKITTFTATSTSHTISTWKSTIKTKSALKNSTASTKSNKVTKITSHFFKNTTPENTGKESPQTNFKESNTPTIIGGVAGGLGALVLVLVSVYFYMRYKGRQMTSSSKYVNDDKPATFDQSKNRNSDDLNMQKINGINAVQNPDYAAMYMQPLDDPTNRYSRKSFDNQM